MHSTLLIPIIQKAHNMEQKQGSTSAFSGGLRAWCLGTYRRRNLRTSGWTARAGRLSAFKAQLERRSSRPGPLLDQLWFVPVHVILPASLP